MTAGGPRLAVVDCRLSNLASVAWACEAVGFDTTITHDPADLAAADAIVLPGVGAFGEAMERLTEAGLDTALRRAVDAGTPLLGVCLGLQLLFERSVEFGEHAGLGLLPGSVVPVEAHDEATGRRLRVPHVGWSPVEPAAPGRWHDTPLARTAPGTWMYFVHSFAVQPADPADAVATARYGDTTFVCAAGRGSIFGCQFHPERSGPDGLTVYRTLLDAVRPTTERAS